MYAYAPRKFRGRNANKSEKTDYLLSRDIKTSVSFYYARIVPIRKKKTGPCVYVLIFALWTVESQKYSFPFIEDCLSHLANKAVFNLLDMKDSFYQIKVHSDDTKYFSFATLDGQFEYNRLPFGFCPPSFKNVSYKSFNHLLEQINWSQIRINKLIVYIDDILGNRFCRWKFRNIMTNVHYIEEIRLRIELLEVSIPENQDWIYI